MCTVPKYYKEVLTMSKISDYILTENKMRNCWRFPEIGGKYSITGICNGQNISYDDVIIIKSGLVRIEGEEYILLKKIYPPININIYIQKN